MSPVSLLFATPTAISSTTSCHFTPLLLSPRCPRHSYRSQPILASLQLGGAGGDLSGHARRILRSEAGRRSAAGSMATYNVTAPEGDEENAVVLELWKSKYLKAIDDLLNKHELIRLKLHGAKKRSRAAHFGGILALSSQAVIFQSIGHTVLLYRPLKDGKGIDISPEPQENDRNDSRTKGKKERMVKKS